MKIETVVASHLSIVYNTLKIHNSFSVEDIVKMKNHLKLAEILVSTFPDISTEISEEELQKIFKKNHLNII